MARITTPSAAPVSPMSHDHKASFGPTHKGVFRKEGDYWRVGYDGTPIRLKDIRGLGYIAHLLRYPHTEFHVLDLHGGIASQREDEITHTINGSPRHDEDLEKAGMHIDGSANAGQMLDQQAKLAYRRRLVELREELAEAKRLGRVERAEQAALKKAGCKTIFKDEGISGATTKRPALLRCLRKLEHGDTLVVCKLDLQ